MSDYKYIKVKPASGALGALIEGVDISAGIDKATVDELYRAFLEFQVIFLRNQTLTPTSFADFVGHFGPLRKPAYAATRDDHPFVSDLVRRADVPKHYRNVGDRWHSDNAPQERPSMGFSLYCVEAPPWGGDTMFASMYNAYDQLSDAMKELADKLIVMNSRSGVFGPDGKGGPGKKPLVHKGMEDHYKVDEAMLRDVSKEMPHPLVRVIPQTGRKCLYIAGDYAIRFQGMTPEESIPLINYFNQLVSRPENTCRFRWEKGSIALLDNRCTQHFAVNDYAGFHREMMRIETEGERPFGPAMPAAAA